MEHSYFLYDYGLINAVLHHGSINMCSCFFVCQTSPVKYDKWKQLEKEMNVGRVSCLNCSNKHTIIAELILFSYACLFRNPNVGTEWQGRISLYLKNIETCLYMTKENASLN